jgi:photosystem II stability/assembly factor-like uncharacterized protein
MLAMTILALPISCKKSSNQPASPVRKQYAWAVGSQDSTHFGLILFTPDGGNNWIRKGGGLPVLQGVDLMDVWAVDSNTVWIVGTDNCILKTSNGGASWTRFTVGKSGTNQNLLSVSVTGSADVWVSGTGGRVYNSPDGGNNWTVFDTSFFHNGIMQGIYSVNSQLIYVTGGIEGSKGNYRGFITRTTNGGQSWDSIVPENNYNRNEWIGVKAFDARHVIVYGGHSHYVYTNDGASSWINDSIKGTGGTGGADINCLTMLSAQTWWGAFDYDGIYMTINSGILWTKQASVGPVGMWLFGIDYYDSNLCIITGQSSDSKKGKIIKTSNGGALWELKYYTSAWINKVCFIKN